ncbi:MAG TPA: type I methionyl aminopeptidase [Candidatus Sulfotelmatobacter sp.]|nr:type I methionyl aminopeptidase [Candidatus Sulfotelmatobacter sp.]
MCIETEAELEALIEAGRVVRRVLEDLRAAVRPGITTAALDAIGARTLRAQGARSAPRLVYGFPGDNCISVNDEIVHGVPSERALEAGDLVKLDVTAEKDGFMADAAITVPVGRVAARARALAEAAEHAFHAALREVRPGRRACDVGAAVEAAVRRRGFRVVRALTGHGIGRTIHEAPTIPNWGDPTERAWLEEGLVITLEPIISAGSADVVEGPDGWTLRTADGALAAHFEHTLVVRKGAPLLLTAA